MAHQKPVAGIGRPGRIDRPRHAVECRQRQPVAAVRDVEQQAVVPARLVFWRKDADIRGEMHQAIASALGQVDIGDGAVQRMRRIDGEMRRAVELLITPDIAKFPTIGERLVGF